MAIAWWRAIARRPAIVLATAAALAAALVPHVVQSIAATGRPLGILETSAGVPRESYVGEGLVTYLTSNPLAFYGALIGPLALIGAVGVVRRPSRPAVVLAAIAVGQLVALGLTSHAQPRYVYVASALLAVIGVDTARHALAARPRLARAAGAIVVAAWLAAAVAMVPYNRWLAGERAPLVAAARAIRDDAGGGRCLVACRVVTQLMWYTGCDGFLLRDLTKLPPWPTDVRRYVASVPHGTAPIEPIAASQHATAIALPTGEPRAQLWRLE